VPPSIVTLPPLLLPLPPALPPCNVRPPPAEPVELVAPAPPATVSVAPAVPAAELPVACRLKLFGVAAVPVEPELPTNKSLPESNKARVTLFVMNERVVLSVVPKTNGPVWPFLNTSPEPPLPIQLPALVQISPPAFGNVS